MIWNFNESPIIIIIEKRDVKIYNGFKLSSKHEGLLHQMGGIEELDNFNYFKITAGQTWKEYQTELSYKNRIDHKLLFEIRSTRELILNEFPETNDKEREKKYIKITNAILGKIIFIRYLIDRNVELKYNNYAKIWTNDDLCSLLEAPNEVRLFFDYLSDPNDGFNGDLFPLTNDEYDSIPVEAYSIIIRLLKSESVFSGQKSLFDFYDFSIIPIEFISNIYEFFIGIENQSKIGAYYTPLFLVDYVLSETIVKAIESDPNRHYRVLDPACGSGVFLVEILRKLIDQYITNNGSKNKSKIKEKIKEITTTCIYGIDQDESAIQVAIFSIYLTLLDYMNPPEISSFKFPSLLNTNFFCNDFFNTDAEFNSKLENINFSFIIGNPPWMRGKNDKKKMGKEPLYIKYINERGKREKRKGEPFISIGNKEIAQAFLLRTSDFSDENTKVALIVTSKVLYNLKSLAFREYFLHNYKIEQVFELAPVRREVFDKSNDKAISPACIIFFQYSNGKETGLNIVEHISLKPSYFFSLFKIFIINRNDIQSVQQDFLKKYDWLWKALIYGSFLDFNFIKRLKSEYKPIKSIIDGDDILVKQGIKRVDGDKKFNVDKLLGWDFLDLRNEIQQFYISPDHSKWDLTTVGYIYMENDEICEEIFTPPMLLIKETVNTKLESMAAISSTKLLFTDKITSIKFRQNDATNNYYMIASLINSTLFAYFVLISSSTAGIMIEQQINDIERFSFPHIHSEEIINEAKNLESLKKTYISEYSLETDKFIKQAENKINELIINAFGLNRIERTLLNYSKEILIPMVMRHKNYDRIFSPCNMKDKILLEYINLFIERFKLKFIDDNKRFMVEVWYSRQIIGMFFKVIAESEYKQDVIWKDKQNEDHSILQTIIKLGVTKITDQLFVRKDVRGFSKDCFYIFKPNEKWLWHKAICYLDINEFADAMLKTAGKAHYE
jgi:hypothetical protein